MEQAIKPCDVKNGHIVARNSQTSWANFFTNCKSALASQILAPPVQ
jgi:hypothetical protein